MLKLENVTKYYKNSTSIICALKKINLELHIGEFVAITGESGSGKTTLLNIISGFDSYEDGEIYFNGKQTSFYTDKDWENYRQKEISFVFQNYNLIDSYTVLDNVACIYIMNGLSYKQAKNKAKEVLKKVGLNDEISKKAIKLSGGQKQRLAIARALARETNIIVADEPTGNLDEKNGKAIMELFKSISKDKLIIIVTHNQAQIEPYITRKIRLHDGQIVDDIVINKDYKEYKLKNDKEGKISKKIYNFIKLNIRAQPIKTLLLFLIILICSLSSFIFIANFKANINDNKTKVLSSEIFTNFDDTRLLVRTFDKKIITDDILESIKIKKIKSIEKYDTITDINYFRPSDYKYVVQNGYIDSMNPVTVDMSYYQLLDYNHFMRSSTSLTEDMLKAGRLPTDLTEMVIYSNDENVLNTKETIFFVNRQKWGDSEKYKYEVEIVGILKENTDQAYFSEKLCRVMDMTMQSFNFIIEYGVYNKYSFLQRSLYVNKIVVDPELKDKDISFSEEMVSSAKDYVFQENNAKFSYSNYTFLETYSYEQTRGHSISSNAIGVSQDVFNKMYQFFMEKNQFVVFIDDYAYVSDVKNKLSDLGFDAISCFDSCTKEYDVSKVITRYVNLGISIIALLIVNLISIILIYTLLKLKKNDYIILNLNGMQYDLSCKINGFEIIIYGLISCIFVILISIVLFNISQVEIILDILKYIKVYDYIILIVVIMISCVSIGVLYGNFLKKRIRVSSLRED